MPITLQHQLGILTLATLAMVTLPAFAFAGSQNFTSSSDGGKGCLQSLAPAGSSGGTGGGSSFNTTVVGNGGTGGTGGYSTSAGSAGTASGGDTNTTGGGAAGGGATNNGTPTISGCGNYYGYWGLNGTSGAGGAGGRAVKTYAAGDLTVGAGITVIVGSGGGSGAGGVGNQYCAYGGSVCTGNTGNAGTAGKVSITWTLPSASRDLTVSKAVSVSGNVTVESNLTKGSGTFVIDNPANPDNELLYHSFVESPDALNEYTGTAVIGKNGEAIVRLPDYFEALNGDYQYFVRPVDTPMGGLYVKQEV